jgi:hypothetical protein
MRVLKLLVVLAMMSGGVAFGAPGHGRGGGGLRQAPEPVTLVGIAIGAGVVGVVAYRKRR